MSDFFAMGGYAYYVWGSYLVTLLFMVAELLLVMRRRRRLWERLLRMRRVMATTHDRIDDETPA